jgi:hypothetical protein
MWWVRNGFMGYYMGFEKSMARYLQDSVSFRCGYNISNVVMKILIAKTSKR